MNRCQLHERARAGDRLASGILQLELGQAAKGSAQLLEIPDLPELLVQSQGWDITPESRQILERLRSEWQAAPSHPPLANDPVGASLALYRCGKRFLEGNPAHALSEANRAWTSHPTYQAAALCANLLAHLELHQEALDMWEISLQMPKADAYGWSARGEFRLKLGDLTGALADLNRAVLLAPDAHFLYTSRAAVYEALGDLKAARQDEFQAVRLRPVVQPVVSELRRTMREQQKSQAPQGARDFFTMLALLLTSLLFLGAIVFVARQAAL